MGARLRPAGWGPMPASRGDRTVRGTSRGRRRERGAQGAGAPDPRTVPSDARRRRGIARARPPTRGACSRSSTTRCTRASTRGTSGSSELIGRDLDRAEFELRRGHDVLVAMGDIGVRSTIGCVLGGRPVPPGDARRGARARRLQSHDRGGGRSRLAARWRTARARVLSYRGEHDEALDTARGGGRAGRADRLPGAEGLRPRRARRGARARRPHRRGHARRRARDRVLRAEGQRRVCRARRAQCSTASAPAPS